MSSNIDRNWPIRANFLEAGSYSENFSNFGRITPKLVEPNTFPLILEPPLPAIMVWPWPSDLSPHNNLTLTRCMLSTGPHGLQAEGAPSSQELPIFTLRIVLAKRGTISHHNSQVCNCLLRYCASSYYPEKRMRNNMKHIDETGGFERKLRAQVHKVAAEWVAFTLTF